MIAWIKRKIEQQRRAQLKEYAEWELSLSIARRDYQRAARLRAIISEMESEEVR